MPLGSGARPEDESVERELVDRAVIPEVAESYLDVWGEKRVIEPATREKLLHALGDPKSSRKKLSIKKGKCHEPVALQAGGRVWGFMVQLYGVRSARNWGIGDFGDLRGLIELAARLGAATVGVNPLHASGTSPYSPSSRHALNVLYIDVEALPEYRKSPRAQRLVRSAAFQKRLKALRSAELVDYEGVRNAKLEVLGLLFQHKSFSRNNAKGAKTYALFEALREKLGDDWRRWPQAYRDPQSASVRRFAKTQRRRVAFHEYLQWSARTQLDALQRRALELGMPIGLYVDLALGADAGGAEVWGDQEAFALEATCGAPPDEFNPKGQDWGLPPYNPRVLKARGYAPFAELLRANMPEGGALRMDHVMALTRLWWIPSGEKPPAGGYVHYPFEDLLAVLAHESRQLRCMVVGEDLGTVTPEFRRALNEAGVLSYRPLLFEKNAQGEFAPPQAYPREALTCVSTHDLPTWKGFFQSADLSLRAELGLTVDAEKERTIREADAAKLLSALKCQGLDGSAQSAHVFIARTPCKIMMVQPEDVFELTEQANLPGSIDEHPNWRRKLPLPLEAWQGGAHVGSLARALAPLRGTGVTVPRATYRLQFHKDFRFRDATALVPYLAALGVSHVYASPFLKARAGSVHGYDIVDHARLNPEIGTEAELKALLAELGRHGMGAVLDIVPNHMGVLHADNAWWLDVLEKGECSRYAKFFDIDWQPANPQLRGKVLLGVLGGHYGEVLERGELKLAKDGIRYFNHCFPLRPGTRPRQGRLQPLALHQLLERQHYRLAFWRVASDDINYRRFFEIADLAALRVEDADVFEATHALIARLCASGVVHGLRIDHPDGLADPRVYFERLRAMCEVSGLRPWIVVEKIIAGHETLPEDWPVQGTTGYRFANVLTGLFIDAAAESRFERTYQRFTRERRSFDEIAYQSRLLIMGTTLAAELNMLTNRLTRIAAGNRFTRDYTAGALRKALAEIAANFPVYRTYVSAQGASETDRRHIDWAVGKARRATRIADPSVFDFVRSVLLLETEAKDSKRKQAMLEFATRFQQFSAPVVAKGDEDTAFYRYHRLVAVNEVGGDPRAFGFSLKAFHAASEDRAKNWPHTMIGSSTHDTKRSEDVRARLAVLSEMPSAWRLMLWRWSRINRAAPAPSRTDEYLFYQSLLGIWPPGTPSAADLKSISERLNAFMLKAAREAKVHTSWINPDQEYEAALERFVTTALANDLFVKDVADAAARISRLGMLSGLSQAVIKVASPGVPDYYQGTELWDFSLVDPDNRRPVDYAARKSLLKRLDSASSGRLLETLADGTAKLQVIRKGLEVRREFVDVFRQPAYLPLYADGGKEDHIVAFAMRNGARSVVAVAPRLFASLMRETDLAPLGATAWGDSSLSLPEGRYENVLTGEIHQVNGKVKVADLLAAFPVALLVTRASPA